MGKVEEHNENWRRHSTVSHEHRRQRLATKVINVLEASSEQKRLYFIDLFVSLFHCKAIKMYNSLGFVVYRTVLEYYTRDLEKDAYDTRKALSRDVHKKSVVPFKHPVLPERH